MKNIVIFMKNWFIAILIALYFPIVITFFKNFNFDFDFLPVKKDNAFYLLFVWLLFIGYALLAPVLYPWGISLGIDTD